MSEESVRRFLQGVVGVAALKLVDQGYLPEEPMNLKRIRNARDRIVAALDAEQLDLAAVLEPVWVIGRFTAMPDGAVKLGKLIHMDRVRAGKNVPSPRALMLAAEEELAFYAPLRPSNPDLWNGVKRRLVGMGEPTGSFRNFERFLTENRYNIKYR